MFADNPMSNIPTWIKCMLREQLAADQRHQLQHDLNQQNQLHRFNQFQNQYRMLDMALAGRSLNNSKCYIPSGFKGGTLVISICQ